MELLSIFLDNINYGAVSRAGKEYLDSSCRQPQGSAQSREGVLHLRLILPQRSDSFQLKSPFAKANQFRSSFTCDTPRRMHSQHFLHPSRTTHNTHYLWRLSSVD